MMSDRRHIQKTSLLTGDYIIENLMELVRSKAMQRPVGRPPSRSGRKDKRPDVHTMKPPAGDSAQPPIQARGRKSFRGGTANECPARDELRV